MAPLSYRRHRFPPEIIQHAIWLYLRFTLSYRDVEELLAERGLDVSYETVRRWVLKFGPLIARKLRQGRPRPSAQWHLDEMVVRIAGKRMYLWRAVARACRGRQRNRPVLVDALAFIGAALGGGAVQLPFAGVWAMILGFAVWGDVPTSGLLVGSAIVVASGVYILWRETVQR
jgi:hypothetical protein